MPNPEDFSAFGALAWPIGAAACGLIAGRMANACIDRLPVERPLERPFLSCAVCRTRGGLLGMVPILGWLADGGRCRFCRTKVSTQKPVVEAVNAVLWLLIAGMGAPSLRGISTMGFVTVLLILSLIDLEHQLLPDILTLPGIVLGVAATWLPGWPVTLWDSALSAAVGYFAMMGLARAAEFYYGEEALGQGDWKMVAMLGAFLGSTKLVAVVLMANVTGALVGLLLVTVLGDEGRQKLPLGTFLGASGVVLTFF